MWFVFLFTPVVDEDDSDSDELTRRSRRTAARRNFSYCEPNSDDSDFTGRKKKQRPRVLPKMKSKKKKRRIIESDDSEDFNPRGGHKRVSRKYEDDSDFDAEPVVGKRRARSQVNYKKLLGSDSDEEEEAVKPRKVKKNVVKSDSEYSAETDNYFDEDEDDEEESKTKSTEKDPPPKRKRLKNRIGKSEDSEEEEEEDEEETEAEEEEGSSDDAGGKGRLEQYRTKRPAVVSSIETKVNGHQTGTSVTAVPAPNPEVQTKPGKLDIENLLQDTTKTAPAEEGPAGELEDDIAPINDDEDLDNIDDLVNYVTMD